MKKLLITSLLFAGSFSAHAWEVTPMVVKFAPGGAEQSFEVTVKATKEEEKAGFLITRESDSSSALQIVDDSGNPISEVKHNGSDDVTLKVKFKGEGERHKLIIAKNPLVEEASQGSGVSIKERYGVIFKMAVDPKEGAAAAGGGAAAAAPAAAAKPAAKPAKAGKKH